MLKIRFLFQPSQDLSPIYEEIHGGSRSSISGNSVSSGSRSVISTGSSGNHVIGSDNGILVSGSGIERGKFYYALYQFTASESTMLSMFRGQVRMTQQFLFEYSKICSNVLSYSFLITFAIMKFVLKIFVLIMFVLMMFVLIIFNV